MISAAGDSRESFQCHVQSIDVPRAINQWAM